VSLHVTIATGSPHPKSELSAAFYSRATSQDGTGRQTDRLTDEQPNAISRLRFRTQSFETKSKTKIPSFQTKV